MIATGVLDAIPVDKGLTSMIIGSITICGCVLLLVATRFLLLVAFLVVKRQTRTPRYEYYYAPGIVWQRRLGV